MDELYNDNDTSKQKINLNVAPANTVDPHFEIANLKKKHSKSLLAKHLNSLYPDDTRRKAAIAARIKQKLEDKKLNL